MPYTCSYTHDSLSTYLSQLFKTFTSINVSSLQLLREVQEENQKLYKENEEVRKKVKALKESKQIEKKEREEAERYEKTNVPAELSEEIKRLTRKCEDTNAVNDKFKEEMDVLIAEKRNLEETCEDQKHEVRSLQRKVSENERDQQNTQQIEAKYKKLCNKLEDTNKELEETKLRLVFTWAHEPCREIIDLPGFRPYKTQTSSLS